MKVKELFKELKGQYTNYVPYHTDRRDVPPFQCLPKDLRMALEISNEEFEKVLGEKEVVEYCIKDVKTTRFSMNDFVKNKSGKITNEKVLNIYFK